jgi:ribose-phosphate pyrophosphokinase
MDGLAVPSRGLKLLSGGANRPLAEAVAESMGVPLTRVNLGRFADGEISVRIDENVRGNDVFILQPTNPPGENILEMLLMIDAAKRASAARITCVIPYYGYGRQDRKDQPRVPIGAKLMANMIVSAGADRVLGIDFHQHQLQGFFDIPVDHLYAMPVFANHYKKKNLIEPVVVAPDVGSAKMARGFAKRLNATLAIIDKRRPAANVSEVVNVVGEVTGRDCILVDDMIDTAGTLVEAARVLREAGAARVFATATHGVFSGPAFERLAGEEIEEIVVTDTIPLTRDAPDKIRVLSVADILARSIRSIFTDGSVSELFAGENQLF